MVVTGARAKDLYKIEKDAQQCVDQALYMLQVSQLLSPIVHDNGPEEFRVCPCPSRNDTKNKMGWWWKYYPDSIIIILLFYYLLFLDEEQTMLIRIWIPQILLLFMVISLHLWLTSCFFLCRERYQYLRKWSRWVPFIFNLFAHLYRHRISTTSGTQITTSCFWLNWT